MTIRKYLAVALLSCPISLLVGDVEKEVMVGDTPTTLVFSSLIQSVHIQEKGYEIKVRGSILKIACNPNAGPSRIVVTFKNGKKFERVLRYDTKAQSLYDFTSKNRKGKVDCYLKLGVATPNYKDIKKKGGVTSKIDFFGVINGKMALRVVISSCKGIEGVEILSGTNALVHNERRIEQNGILIFCILLSTHPKSITVNIIDEKGEILLAHYVQKK